MGQNSLCPGTQEFRGLILQQGRPLEIDFDIPLTGHGLIEQLVFWLEAREASAICSRCFLSLRY
jgi:hypothetical protein